MVDGVVYLHIPARVRADSRPVTQRIAHTASVLTYKSLLFAGNELAELVSQEVV